MEKIIKREKQISDILLSLGKFFVYLILFSAPFYRRRVLIYHQIGPIAPEFASTILYLVDVLLIVAVMFYLFAHWVWPPQPVKLTPWFITLPLAILVVLSGISFLWATSKASAVEMFVRLLWLGMLYLFIRNELTNWKKVAWVLAISMAIQSVVATAQFYNQGPIGLFFLGEKGSSITVPGVWIRGYGFSIHPNILGGFLTIGLSATLTLVLRAKHNKERFILAAIFGLGVSGLLSTFSRSAWLGMALAFTPVIAAIMLKSSIRNRWGSSLLILGLVSVFVLSIYIIYTPDYFITRLIVPISNRINIGLNIEPPSENKHAETENLLMRQKYNSVANQMIKNSFPFGVGSANFSLVSYLDYPELSALDPDLAPSAVFQPVHNVLLLITAELGVLGGFSWVFLLTAFVVSILFRFNKLIQNTWLLGWTMVVICLFTISFFDFYIWGLAYGQVMLFTSLGLWTGLYMSDASK